MYVARVPLVPEAVETLATVEVVDPWSPSRKTRFDIVEARLVAQKNGAGQTMVSLRAHHNGEERLLPEALVALWRAGEITTARVPALLHATGDRYGARDAEMILPMRRHVYILWALLLISLPCFGVAAQAWLAMRSSTSHGVRAATVEELGATPLHDFETVALPKTVPILATTPLDAVPPHAPQLNTARGPMRMVVIKLGDHERAVWTTMPPQVDVIALVGVVWPTKALDPAAQRAVDQLAARFPKLEREHVLGQMWVWSDSRDDLKVPLFGAMGSLIALFGVGIWYVMARRIARRRRELAWLRSFAAARNLTATSAGAPSAPA